MKLINNTPDQIGNYGVIQTSALNYVPEHMAVWPDELETQTYSKYMGFVTVEFETVEPAPMVAESEPAEAEQTEEAVEAETADAAEEAVDVSDEVEEIIEPEPVEDPEPDTEGTGEPVAPYLRVVSYTGNQEALDAYLATLPEPEEQEPTEEDDTAAMLVDHEYRLTLLELGLTE